MEALARGLFFPRIAAGPFSRTLRRQTKPTTPDACASGHEFAATDCALTWHGITVYGVYDVGAGWVSHGLPDKPV